MSLPEEGETPGPAEPQHCRNVPREWERQQACVFSHALGLLAQSWLKGTPGPLSCLHPGIHGVTVTIPRPANSSLKSATLISEIISTPGHVLGAGTRKEAGGDAGGGSLSSNTEPRTAE